MLLRYRLLFFAPILCSGFQINGMVSVASSRIFRSPAAGSVRPYLDFGSRSSRMNNPLDAENAAKDLNNPLVPEDEVKDLKQMTAVLKTIMNDLKTSAKINKQMHNKVGAIMEISLRDAVSNLKGSFWSQRKMLSSLPDLLQYPLAVQPCSESLRSKHLAVLVRKVAPMVIPFAEALQNRLSESLTKGFANLTPPSVTPTVEFVKDGEFSVKLASSFQSVRSNENMIANKEDLALVKRLKWYVDNVNMDADLLTAADGPGLAIYAWLVDETWFRCEVELDCAGMIEATPVEIGGSKGLLYRVECGEIKTSSCAGTKSQLSRSLLLIKQVLEDTLDAQHFALCGYCFDYQNEDPEDAVTYDEHEDTAVAIKFVRLNPRPRFRV